MLIEGISAPDLTPEDLRLVRAVLGMTAREMAEAVGCSPSAILKWEAGRIDVSRRAVAGVLRLTATPEWEQHLERLEDLDAALAEARERMGADDREI